MGGKGQYLIPQEMQGHNYLNSPKTQRFYSTTKLTIIIGKVEWKKAELILTLLFLFKAHDELL